MAEPTAPRPDLPGALYLRLVAGRVPVARTVDYGGRVLVDLDEDDMPLGVEILGGALLESRTEAERRADELASERDALEHRLSAAEQRVAELEAMVEQP